MSSTETTNSSINDPDADESEIPNVHDIGDLREYIQVTPSSEEVTDTQILEQISSLHDFKKDIEGGLLAQRFKKPDPIKIEILAYSEGEDEPVEIYYGAEDNLDTLEDRLREIYPPTFAIQRRSVDVKKKIHCPVKMDLEELEAHLQNGNLLFTPDTLAASEVKEDSSTKADGAGEKEDEDKKTEEYEPDLEGIDARSAQIFKEKSKFELPADVDHMNVESRRFHLDPPHKIPDDGTLSTLDRPTYTDDGTIYARPSKEAMDIQAVRWFGVADRKHDWMTTLAPARPAEDEDDSDDDESEDITVLSSLFNRLTSMKEPAMVQILFQAKRDWSSRAETRKEKIRKGEETIVQKLATDIKAASHSNNTSDDDDQPKYPDSFNARTGKPGDLSDSQRQKLDRINKKEPNNTFSVNIRAITARPLIGAESRNRTARQQYNDIRELSNLLDTLNGRYYGIEGIPIKDEGLEETDSVRGKIKKRVNDAKVSAENVYDRLVDRELLAEYDKDKFLNRLFQSSKQQPEIVMNPRELASVFILPSGEKMSREAYRMTHSRQKDAQPLTPPKPKLINQYDNGMAIGRPINQQNEPKDSIIHLPSNALTTHYGRFGASGSGKTVAVINDLLTLHENVDGPTILIDPKGGNMCPSYLRAHFAKYRTLDNVLYFKAPETLPAIPFFDIRPLINGRMNREDAIQHKVDHFHEVMRMVMGDDYERAYVGRMIITYMIKMLFDRMNGSNFFPFEALVKATRNFLEDEEIMPTSTIENPKEALYRHTEQSDRDFKQTMNSVINRLDKIRENIYIYYIFELMPRWEDGEYITPQGPMSEVDLTGRRVINTDDEESTTDQEQAENEESTDEIPDRGKNLDGDRNKSTSGAGVVYKDDKVGDTRVKGDGEETANDTDEKGESEEENQPDGPEQNESEGSEEQENEDQEQNESNTSHLRGPPVLDFSEYFDEDAVILFDIGDLRGESQRALTMVIVSQLWAQLKAERRRAEDLTNPDRPQVNLIVEEAKDVIGADLFQNKLIPEAREFNLSLGFVMQYPEQAKYRGTDMLYTELINNVQSKMFGKISVQDSVAESLTHGLRTETSMKNKLQSLPRGRWIADLPAPKYGMERPSPFSLEALDIPPGHPDHHREFNKVGEHLFQQAKETLHATHEVHSLGSLHEHDKSQFDGEYKKEKVRDLSRDITEEDLEADVKQVVEGFEEYHKEHNSEWAGNVNLDDATPLYDPEEDDSVVSSDTNAGQNKNPEATLQNNGSNSGREDEETSPSVKGDSESDTEADTNNTTEQSDPQSEEAPEPPEQPSPEEQMNNGASQSSPGLDLPGENEPDEDASSKSPGGVHQFGAEGGSVDDIFNQADSTKTKGSGSIKDPEQLDDVEPTDDVRAENDANGEGDTETAQDVQDDAETDSVDDDAAGTSEPTGSPADAETSSQSPEDPQPGSEQKEPIGELFGIPDYGDHIDFSDASVSDADIARFLEDSPGESLADSLNQLEVFNKTARGAHELVRVYMDGHDDVTLDDLDDLPLIDADRIRDELTPDEEGDSPDTEDEDVDDQQVSIPGSNTDQIRGATVDDIDLEEYEITEAQGEFLLSVAKAFMGEKEGYDLIEDSMTDFKSDLSDSEFQELLDRNLVEKSAINRWRYFTLLPEGWKMLPVEKPGLPGEGDWGEKTPHRYGVELLYRYLDQENEEEWVKPYYNENGVVFDIMAREPTIEGNVILGEVETDSKDKEGVMEDYQKMSDYSHAECIWIFPSKDTMESVANIIINETDGEQLSSVDTKTASNIQEAIGDRNLDGMDRAYTFKGLRDML